MYMYIIWLMFGCRLLELCCCGWHNGNGIVSMCHDCVYLSPGKFVLPPHCKCLELEILLSSGYPFRSLLYMYIYVTGV